MQKAADEKPYRPSSSIVRCTRDYALATWGSVFIVIWRKNTTAVGVQDLRTQCKKFGTAHPEGVLLLTIIHDGAPAPEAAERSALAEFLKSADHIRASAVVMEGTSFRAAFVRGVVTGLTMLAHQPFPHQVCSMDAAARLFAKVAEESKKIKFDARYFQRGIADLRAKIESDPAARGSAGVDHVA
jgi:hypothetical protein